MSKQLKADECWIPKIPHYEFPGEELMIHNKVDWKINKNEAALLVHDFQQFWLSRYDNASELESKVVKVVNACRQAGIPVIYSEASTTKHPSERGLALELWGPGIGAGIKANVSEAKVVHSVTPQSDDFIINKPKYSTFYRTNMEDVMRVTNRSQLIMVGVYGHHGILATALDAYMRNIKPFFVIDAIGDYCLDDHIMAAKYISEVCGVVTTADHVEHALINS
jgi:bifunctional isochorismate lyase/aryl carrier protein